MGELKHYGVPGMKWGIRKKYISKSGMRRAKGKKTTSGKNVAKTKVNNLPPSTLKTGLNVVNNILGISHLSSNVAVTVLGAASIAAGPELFVAGAVGTALEIGVHKLAQMGIDRMK